MQAALFKQQVQVSRRLIALLLPLLLLAPIHSEAARQLQARPMPPSLVLVLKLVSKTHVKPTTGIVIAEDGLVLVPADFVSSEGELIVLDGGNDIVKNGRPATVLYPAIDGGLAVLSVKGLNRPAVTASGNGSEEEPGLHMVAFPPAEFIAKGAPPLWVALEAETSEAGQPLSISPDTPQPYIFGAIMNECGYLVGVSTTTGQQSLQHTEQPSNIFVDELQNSLGLQQVALPVASCETEAQPAAVVSSPGAESADSSAVKNPAARTRAAIEKPTTGRPAVIRKRLNPFQGSVPPGALESAARPSLWRSVPVWMLLLGLVMFSALAWKALAFFRLLRAGDGTAAVQMTGSQPEVLSAEPDTAPLAGVNDPGRPRAAPEFELEPIDAGERPEGCDGVLVVAGRMDTDTQFKRFCFVNTADINVVIGRNGADINIESSAISRRHARLESDGQHLTIADLGSKNGTSVRDIPCLPGEVFHIEPEDDIFLGDIEVKVYINMQRAEWA